MQQMCGKAANSYPSTIKFVPECYKTQETWDKAVDTCTFLFNFAPEWYKTRETYHKVTSKGSFILTCCLGRYEAQKVW